MIINKTVESKSVLEERMNGAEREVHSMMSEKSDQEVTELAFNKFKIEPPIFNSSEKCSSSRTNCCKKL